MTLHSSVESRREWERRSRQRAIERAHAKSRRPRPTMKRTGGVKRIRPDRCAKKFIRNFRSKERVKFGKHRCACQACGREPTRRLPNINAHYQARGMGGCGGNYLKIVILCPACDMLATAAPRTFWEDRNLNPQQLAAEHQGHWLEHAAANGLEP